MKLELVVGVFDVRMQLFPNYRLNKY